MGPSSRLPRSRRCTATFNFTVRAGGRRDSTCCGKRFDRPVRAGRLVSGNARCLADLSAREGGGGSPTAARRQGFFLPARCCPAAQAAHPLRPPALHFWARWGVVGCLLDRGLGVPFALLFGLAGVNEGVCSRVGAPLRPSGLHFSGGPMIDLGLARGLGCISASGKVKVDLST